MECPTCGYVFQPLETNCPRCARQPKPTTAPPVVVAPPFSAPPAPSAVVPRKRGYGFLLFLVSVLSIVCIFLSGLLMGNFWTKKDETPPETYVYFPRPHHPMPTSALSNPKDQEREVKLFISCLRYLENLRHAIMQEHQSTGTRSGLFMSESPNRPAAVQAQMSLEQVQRESDRLIQVRQQLERLRPPQDCVDLYNAYNNYLIDTENYFIQLIRGLQAMQRDAFSSKQFLVLTYGSSKEHLRSDAQMADGQLRRVCAAYSLLNPFVID